MGVEVRVPRAGRAMPEPGRDEPITVEHRMTTLTPANPTRRVLEDTQRGLDRGVGGVADLV